MLSSNTISNNFVVVLKYFGTSNTVNSVALNYDNAKSLFELFSICLPNLSHFTYLS